MFFTKPKRRKKFVCFKSSLVLMIVLLSKTNFVLYTFNKTMMLQELKFTLFFIQEWVLVSLAVSLIMTLKTILTLEEKIFSTLLV